MLEGFDLLLFELLVICNVFFSILAYKPDKTKGKEYDKIRNESHEIYMVDPNLATSTGKYKKILLSNV